MISALCARRRAKGGNTNENAGDRHGVVLVLCVIVLAIAYVFYNYVRVRKGRGHAEMAEMACDLPQRRLDVSQNRV